MLLQGSAPWGHVSAALLFLVSNGRYFPVALGLINPLHARKKVVDTVRYGSSTHNAFCRTVKDDRLIFRCQAFSEIQIEIFMV